MVQACVPRAARLLGNPPFQMKKNYVLDTNVLLHDPHAIFRFEDNNVIIPIYVIEEVDQFKREGSERGRNARSIARVLDELREQRRVALQGGDARLGRHAARRGARASGSSCRAPSTTRRWTRPSCRPRSTCARTTAGARRCSSRWTRTCASAPTRSAWSPQTYENQRVEVEQLDERHDRGRRRRRGGRRLLPRRAASRRASPTPGRRTRACSCATARTPRTPRSAATTRPSARSSALRVPREGVMGVRPRNKEQSFALDLLLDEIDPPGHARRQGGHRQDAPRARRGPQAHDGGRRVHAHARLAPGHAARARHRLPARRRRREAQPVDAAHLRQPRVSLLDGLAQGAARLRRAARERADPGRAAHVHPRPQPARSSSSSSTRRRTSRRTR